MFLALVRIESSFYSRENLLFINNASEIEGSIASAIKDLIPNTCVPADSKTIAWILVQVTYFSVCIYNSWYRLRVIEIQQIISSPILICKYISCGRNWLVDIFKRRRSRIMISWVIKWPLINVWFCSDQRHSRVCNQPTQCNDFFGFQQCNDRWPFLGVLVCRMLTPVDNKRVLSVVVNKSIRGRERHLVSAPTSLGSANVVQCKPASRTDLLEFFKDFTPLLSTWTFYAVF